MTQGLVAKCLTEKGPALSADLARMLVSDYQSPSLQAARQSLRRARNSGVVMSTEPVRFGRDFLFYLERHRPAQYCSAVKENLEKAPGLDRVFKCLLANHGYITRGQIAKISASLPDDAARFKTKRVRTAAIIRRLESLGLIESCGTIPNTYIVGADFRGRVVQHAKFSRALELDQHIFDLFVEWMQHCLMLSWHSHDRRPSPFDAATFNRTAWDVAGPLMFGPFTKSVEVRKGKTKSAFLMGEVLAYRQFSVNDAEATLQRVRAVSLTNLAVSFFPYILARGYSKDAHSRLRNAGVVPLTLADVLGSRAEKLLRLYSDMVTHPDSPTIDAVGQSLELASSVDLKEGLLANILGTLFEMIVTLALKGRGYDTSLQKPLTVATDGTNLEVDVVGVLAQKECLIVECKGRKKGIPEDPGQIRRHFVDRCAAAADPYGWDVTERYPRVEAIFVTSGEFNDECRKVIQSHSRSHGIATTAIDRNDLKAFLDQSGG